jgi:hypothetical protein
MMVFKIRLQNFPRDNPVLDRSSFQSQAHTQELTQESAAIIIAMAKGALENDTGRYTN